MLLMLRRISSVLVPAAALLLLLRCADESRLNNPFDSKTSPDAWKPESVALTVTGPNGVQLKWQQKAGPISGFEVVRIFSGQESTVQLGADARSFEDNSVYTSGSVCGKVTYRLRARAGDRFSSPAEVTSAIDFPSQTAATAGTDQTISQLFTSVEGSVFQAWEEGTWTIVSGSGGAFSQVNGTSVRLDGQAAQAYVLRWTITGPCGSTSDDVKVVLGMPQVVTSAATAIGQRVVTTGGTISGPGASIVTERGICWGTTSSPVVAGQKIANGSGAGTFATSVNELTAATTYFIRAYAMTSAEVVYGNEITFQTLAPVAASVTTQAVSYQSDGSLLAVGEVNSDGGAAVTGRGVCWATSAGPTTAGNKLVIGSGTGSFQGFITGLGLKTTYYIRAFAVNSSGTAYGNEVQITTADIPSVSTGSLTNAQPGGITISGEVLTDGGLAVTDRGIVYSTSENPTIQSSRIAAGSGIGFFSASLTGLTSGITYFARAYAVNGAGAAYGLQVPFSTPLPAPTLIFPSNLGSIDCCYPSFSWSSVSGADSYEIQIAAVQDFSAPVFSTGNCMSISRTSVSVATTNSPSICVSTSTSSNNGTWYWRVRAAKGQVPGVWSSTGTFSYTF